MEFKPRGSASTWFREMANLTTEAEIDAFVEGEMEKMVGYVTELEQSLEAQKEEAMLLEARDQRLHWINSKRKLKERGKTNDEETLLKLKIRETDEKEHPFKAKLRAYEARVATFTEPVLIKNIKTQYKSAVVNSTMTPMSAVMVETLINGTRLQQLMLAQDILMGNTAKMVQESNLRYLGGLMKSDAAHGHVYGDRIVVCPYPMLWTEVDEAVSANNIMLNSVEGAKEELLSGGGEARAATVNARCQKYFKKTFSTSIIPEVFESVKARSTLLRGSGYKVFVGEDGGVVLDDMELAFSALQKTVQALEAKLAETSSNTNYLHQQQQQLIHATQQQQHHHQQQTNMYHIQRQASPTRNSTCYACGKAGHIARNCWNNNGRNNNNSNGGNNNNNHHNNGNNSSNNKRSSSNTSNRGKN